MPLTQRASEILDRHYLELRCGLLDMAAALDRLERAVDAVSIAGDPRLQKIREGLAILAAPGPGRAERIQMLFSDAYESGWMG